MIAKRIAAAVATLVVPVSAALAGAGSTWVVCAPGYPGTTQEAQANMDTFAAAVAKTAGLKAGSLGAVYHETEAGGTERLAKPDAALAPTSRNGISERRCWYRRDGHHCSTASRPRSAYSLWMRDGLATQHRSATASSRGIW